MKRSVLLATAVFTTLSLAALSILNWSYTENDLDIVYKVESRYMATITKSDLHNADSVLDIVPKKASGWWEVSFETVKVVLMQGAQEIQELGYSKDLNDDQKDLLRSIDYSTDFYIQARGKDKHPDTGQIENYTYYFTVTPEHPAKYCQGQDKLIQYLKEGTKKHLKDLQEDLLRPGRVRFTISKTGEVKGAALTSSSGYVEVDKTILKLIENIPDKWQPATNVQGCLSFPRA